MVASQGLGKTLQTISLVAYLREFRGIKGPHMVIVPKSTLHNWVNEFKRFCPVIKVVKFHGNAEERVSVRAAWVASSLNSSLPVPASCCVSVVACRSIKKKNCWLLASLKCA